jgi:thiamine-phosphate diphosphorylase
MTIPRLCYITDGERGTAGRPLREVIERAAEGGVDAVILREREAPVAHWRALCTALAAARRRGLRLIASRRLDLARALALDGVQLTADAVDVATARAWLGPRALLGYSAHSAEEARRAAAAGASYVTYSPIFPTDSKPGAAAQGVAGLAAALRDLPIPALALGGLTPERTAEVLAAGAWGVAAVSAIGAAPDPAAAARAFRRALEVQAA